MDEDEEMKGKCKLIELGKNYFIKKVGFEAGLDSFKCRHSLKRKGQRITNSGAREGEEASAACCLLIMQRDQHEQNEWTDYKGQHRQHLSA